VSIGTSGRGLTSRLWLRERLNDLNDVLISIAVEASELEEFANLFNHGSIVDGPSHRYSSSPPKVQETFIPQDAQRPQHRVGIHAEDCCQVFCWWQAFTRLCLARGDSAANVAGYLIVKSDALEAVDLDIQHSARHSSTMPSTATTDNSPASAEVLIPEARDRQRRRYRRSAIVVFLAVLLVGGFAVLLIAVTSEGNETSHVAPRAPTSAAAVPTVLIGPALCYAPAYDSNAPRRSNSLPTMCPAAYTLTSQGPPHLGLAADPDPGLAPYPSSTSDRANQVALIGSSRGPGERFLVGPASMRLSAATVKSVHAERGPGEWVVDIQLSAAGNAAWRAIPGSGYRNATIPLVIDMGGSNMNGPFFQPTFDSLRQIPGLSRSSAQALVAAIKR
jgi:hypothetical protein